MVQGLIAFSVYPGDQITSTFVESGNNVWTDSWSLTPGSTGSQNGQTAQSGSSSNSFSKPITIINFDCFTDLDLGSVGTINTVNKRKFLETL